MNADHETADSTLSSDAPLRRASLIALSAGALLVVVALGLGLQMRERVATWNRAKGKVVDFSLTTQADGTHSTYAAIVRFTSAAGKSVVFRDVVSTDPPRYRIGEEVTVLYDPAAPSEARMNTFLSLWDSALGFGEWGTGLIVIASLALLRQRTRRIVEERRAREDKESEPPPEGMTSQPPLS